MGLLDEGPAGEMVIPMLWVAVQVDLGDIVQQRERLLKTSLGNAQRGFEIQDRGLIPQDVAQRIGPRRPPRISNFGGLLSASQIARHTASVGEMAPGKGSELIGPAFLGRFIVRNGLCDSHGKLGELDRPRGILRCNALALPAQELCQAPTCKLGLGVNKPHPMLVRLLLESIPQSRSLGPRSREGDIDDTEARREGATSVEVEEPASDPVALRADGDLMEQAAVLGLRTIQRQELIQSLNVEVLVLHALSFPLVQISRG
jgi:hypothetical protein